MKTAKWVMLVERFANLFELIGILAVLLMAFVFEFALNELPCPLCLLQRIGFVAIAFGFLLNLRFGFRPSHYSIVLISALFTSFVALRQISLHTLPDTGGYGSPIFGLHLYTWSFIIAMAIVITTTLLLGIDRQYKATIRNNKAWRHWINILFAITIFVITANIISVVLQCGFSMCPDNPTGYALLIR